MAKRTPEEQAEYLQMLRDVEEDIAYMQRDNAYNARYESQAYYRDPAPNYEYVTPDDFAPSTKSDDENEDTQED